MNKREFLFTASAFVASAFSPSILLAATNKSFNQPVVHVPSEIGQFWTAPREIWLARKSTGEQQRITYWKDGQLERQGYIDACVLLRDVSAGQAVQMDIGLLNLLRAIQGWLVYYNINSPIIVHSGYRTSRTNSRTEGAAKNSFHLKGMAVDIEIPGISIDYLFRLSSVFGSGGLGFYPGKRFIHADTGRVRYWRG